LKRITPGESCQLACIVDSHGEFHSDPKEMARVLVEHWRSVFSSSSCDDDKLKAWFDILFRRKGHNSWDTGLPPQTLVSGR
jgi:hypothetical protein